MEMIRCPHLRACFWPEAMSIRLATEANIWRRVIQRRLAPPGRKVFQTRDHVRGRHAVDGVQQTP